MVIFLGNGQESTVRIWFIWCSSRTSTSVAAVKLPVTEEHNNSQLNIVADVLLHEGKIKHALVINPN
jgi:hypothetical protein